MKSLLPVLFVSLFLFISPSHDAGAATETVIYSFCSQANCADGEQPSSGVSDVKGKLYGTAFIGGNQAGCDGGCGTVFSLDPKTGAEATLYTFCSEADCADGGNPIGGVVERNGKLYGATSNGGTGGGGTCDASCGTVFALQPATGAETVLYSFCREQNCSDGYRPTDGVIDEKGDLYGTTGYGGANGYGTVFSIDAKRGTESVLYSFCTQPHCADGADPERSVIRVQGMLYGTTAIGGTSGHGTVFSLDPATGTETVLYSFCSKQNCADGNLPEDKLLDVNGLLYGTTEAGGRSGCSIGCGTVFSVDQKGGAAKIVYLFCSAANCADGASPAASLIEANGMLFGTTVVGGTYGLGTAFALNPNSGQETVLHSFGGGTDGSEPQRNLTYIKGLLYGTTLLGGAYGEGTVFEITP